ncbi:DM4/DM12 domain-containing protein Desiccate [Rhodnius prolixus]|uniref:Uncharacterized protein n=1 Tax=Rhodnius prolixus TaxID=13249 RepID=T1HCT3_RHOPR
MLIKVVLVSCVLTLASCAIGESLQQLQGYSETISSNNNHTSGSNERQHEARFGLPITYGQNDPQGGYGGVNYTPVKIELGGLFLGTIIGLGAVLLIPKLSHLLSTPNHHGHGYFRSLTETENLYEGFTQAMSRFDEVLGKHHIDSVACLERAACSYAKSAATNRTQFFNNANVLMKFAIEGTKLKTALDRGSAGEDCSVVYPHCNFSKQLIISGIKSAILDNNL